MDVSIQKYLAFVKTVECGSFTRAAGVLNYSQSGISRMIGDLEREWRVTLLERGKSGVRLTSEGTRLLPYAKRVCSEYEKLQAEVDEINIPASEINIDGASERFETNVDIRPYLPEGVNLVEDTAGDIVVTVSIEKEGTRTIDVLVASVKINNLTENLQVTYEPDAEVSLTFRGDQDTLDALDISNAVFVNLQAYTQPGTYDIPVLVDVPEGVTLAEDTTIKLTLEEKENTEVQEEQGQEDQNG